MWVARSSRGLAALLVVVSFAGFAAAQSARRPTALELAGAEPGSIVTINGVRFGHADASGAWRTTAVKPGQVVVTVRQSGWRDDTQTVAVAAGRTTTVRPRKARAATEAEAAFIAADVLAASGKHKEAVALFTDAIARRRGSYPAAQIALARSLFALKQLDEASEAIASVVAANPSNVEARTVSANLQRDRGFYEEAAAEYRKAIAIARVRAPEAHTGLAITLDELGDLAQAAAEFTKAIAQNLDAEPLLYQLRGNVYERLQRPAQALADYMRFLALAPTHPLAPAFAGTAMWKRVGRNSARRFLCASGNPVAMRYSSRVGIAKEGTGTSSPTDSKAGSRARMSRVALAIQVVTSDPAEALRIGTCVAQRPCSPYPGPQPVMTDNCGDTYQCACIRETACWPGQYGWLPDLCGGTRWCPAPPHCSSTAPARRPTNRRLLNSI